MRRDTTTWQRAPSCYCCHNNSIRCDSWHLSVVKHVLMPTRWSADSYVLPKIQLRPTTTRWPFWLWLSRRIVALRRLVKTTWPPGNLQKSSSFFFIFLSTFQFLDNLLTFRNDGCITPPWSLPSPDSRRLFHRWIVKSEEEKEKQDYLDGRYE
jgi:hypothetical protein